MFFNQRKCLIKGYLKFNYQPFDNASQRERQSTVNSHLQFFCSWKDTSISLGKRAIMLCYYASDLLNTMTPGYFRIGCCPVWHFILHFLWVKSVFVDPYAASMHHRSSTSHLGIIDCTCCILQIMCRLVTCFGRQSWVGKRSQC